MAVDSLDASRLQRALDALADDQVILDDLSRRVTAAELRTAIAVERAWLADQGVSRCGIAADNGVGWVVADLALHLGGLVSVPLPPAFTREQRDHALDDAGIDAILTDSVHVGTQFPQFPADHGVAPGSQLRLLRRFVGGRRPDLPHGTSKITYTSGSTGTPKGVCLSAGSLETVAESLVAATQRLHLRSHLCLLPLATLLENVAGVLAPLLAGARSVVPPRALTGIGADVDRSRLLETLRQQAPESIILVPELLRLLVAATDRGWLPPSTLKFVAVGGAVVAPDLLRRAIERGIPAFEGYGLSECCSVVTLNTAAAHQLGSVGRPLPHARVRIDTRGEIHVRGQTMLGYVGEPARATDAWLATGDLGQIDDHGHLHVLGRRRNVFITSFGRNVSPEWVEAEIAQQHGIAQVFVHGERRPYVVALVVPGSPDVDASTIQQAIDAGNTRLPSYAQVRRWLRVPPFLPDHGLATANGRLRREAIERRYLEQISGLYTDALAS
jgi:long-subunit acyl-CoA synthetase (AMP-forming)